MARVTSFTAERMLQIENSTVVGGTINEEGRLFLERRDGLVIDAGIVAGAKGDPGSGVSDIDVSYQSHSSGTQQPTGDWLGSPPLVPAGHFLWIRTVTTYRDPGDPNNFFTTVSYQVIRQGTSGPPGEDGIGIKSTSVQYQESISGINPPSGNWFPNPPEVAPGRFLWTRTIISYTDDTTDTIYSVAKQGANGANGTPGEPGVDGQTTYLHVAYANSEDGTENFSVTDPSGRAYMGTYGSTTSEDSENPEDYTWVLIKGAEGTGISSSAVHYNIGDSGTVPPTGSWSVDVPLVPEGYFLWTRTVVNFSDGASQTSYSVAKSGEKGDKGEPGIPGPPGEDGKPRYTWLKYADTPTSGMSESPVGKTYMGIAYNQEEEAESNDYADYQWSLIRGPQGDQGIPGPPGEDGEILYTWIKYADNNLGGGMSDVPDGKRFIGFAYNQTSPDESTNPGDYQWALIQGEQGPPGEDGEDGTDGISITGIVTYWVLNHGTEPPKPTTKTPPSPWVSDEPEWIRSRVLWRVERVDYSDGSFTWTTVARSSAYTAADQAFEKISETDEKLVVINDAMDTLEATQATMDGKLQDHEVEIADTKEDLGDAVGRLTTAETEVNQAKADAQAARNMAENSIVGQVIQYAVNTSETTAPTSGWSPNTPTRTPGSFIWQRVVITYANDQISTTNPVLVTGNAGAKGNPGTPGTPGAPGSDGSDGVSIESVTSLYRAGKNLFPPLVESGDWTDLKRNYHQNPLAVEGGKAIANFTPGNGTGTSYWISDADDGPLPTIRSWRRFVWSTPAVSGSGGWSGYTGTGYIHPLVAKAGDTITFSFYYRTTSTAPISRYPRVYVFSGSTTTHVQSSQSAAQTISAADGWVRMSHTFTLDQDIDGVGSWIFFTGGPGPVSSGDMEDLTGYQYEVGSITPFMGGDTKYLDDINQRTRFEGEKNNSTTVLEGRLVPGWSSSSSSAKATLGSVGSTPALTVTPTAQSGTGIYTLTDIPQIARSAGTVVATAHVTDTIIGSAHAYANAIRVGEPWSSKSQSPDTVLDAPGIYRQRIYYDNLTSRFQVLLYRGGNFLNAPVKFTNLSLYEGDFFDFSKWQTTEPTYAHDREVWRTEKIVYDDGTVEYTEPTRVEFLNAIESAEYIESLLGKQAYFDVMRSGKLQAIVAEIQDAFIKSANIQELDLGKLTVVEGAEMNEAVIERVWSEVVRTKFLEVTDEIITRDVIATNAITARHMAAEFYHGREFFGGVFNGGEFIQYAAEGGIAVYPDTTGGVVLSDWKAYAPDLLVNTVLSTVKQTGTNSVQTARTGPGVLSFTWTNNTLPEFSSTPRTVFLVVRANRAMTNVHVTTPSGDRAFPNIAANTWVELEINLEDDEPLSWVHVAAHTNVTTGNSTSFYVDRLEVRVTALEGAHMRISRDHMGIPGAYIYNSNGALLSSLTPQGLESFEPGGSRWARIRDGSLLVGNDNETVEYTADGIVNPVGVHTITSPGGIQLNGPVNTFTTKALLNAWTPPNGAQAYVSGEDRYYRRRSGVWDPEPVYSPYAMAAGVVEIGSHTDIGNIGDNKAFNISFPSGRFTQIPIVTLADNATFGRANASVDSISLTGARLVVTKVTGSWGSGKVQWHAVQMTADSGEG